MCLQRVTRVRVLRRNSHGHEGQKAPLVQRSWAGSVGLGGASVAGVSGAGRGGRATVDDRAHTARSRDLSPFPHLPGGPHGRLSCMWGVTRDSTGGLSGARGPAWLSRPAQAWTGSSQARLGLTKPADGAWQPARVCGQHPTLVGPERAC